MECKLYTGQKVVCIAEDSDWFRIPSVAYPKNNGVYEVRGVYKGACVEHPTQPFVGIHLVELVNIPIELGNGFLEEPFFDYRAFKPAWNGKTDISVFHELVKRMPVGEVHQHTSRKEADG